jgi:hypothetical protein
VPQVVVMRLAPAAGASASSTDSPGVFSDGSSSLAGVAGLLLQTSQIRQIDIIYSARSRRCGKQGAEAKELMAEIPVQRSPVRLQMISSETSARAPNLQIQAVSSGDNE